MRGVMGSMGACVMQPVVARPRSRTQPVEAHVRPLRPTFKNTSLTPAMYAQPMRHRLDRSMRRLRGSARNHV